MNFHRTKKLLQMVSYDLWACLQPKNYYLQDFKP